MTDPAAGLRIRRVLPSGALDASFGAPQFASGSCADNTFVEFNQIFPHPDGSVTLLYFPQGGGHFFLKQYTNAGQLDASFGNGGVYDLSFLNKALKAAKEPTVSTPKL